MLTKMVMCRSGELDEHIIYYEQFGWTILSTSTKQMNMWAVITMQKRT